MFSLKKLKKAEKKNIILDFYYLVLITHFTNCIRSEFLSEILTKPPHILTHAGAFLRAILVAHDHRNPSH